MDDLKKAVNAPEKLINANELMEWLRLKIRECVFMNAHAEAATTEEIIRYVKHMPAVDAVPVVRCNDCKYSDTFADTTTATTPLKCLNIRYGGVYPDWYCEHGERRDDDAAD